MIQNRLTEAIQATFPTKARPVEATPLAISPSLPTPDGWIGIDIAKTHVDVTT